MKNFLSHFLPAAAVIAIICCAGECVLLKHYPEASGTYGTYIVFALTATLVGAFAMATLHAPSGRRRHSDSRADKQHIAELETKLKSLEETANHREEFIASFAHELKTPLTAIIGYADMLRSKDMTPKTRFTAAGYIFSEGKRLEALSLKLLDIIVAGKQDFTRRQYDAGYLIREVAAVSAPSTGGDGLNLNIRCEPGQVMIEPDLFKTLLINLVDNARKASKKGQTVELYGKNEEGGFAFYVRDYGRGMKQEELSKITEPFYMIDKSRSRAQNGAGLGLALCQRIAELHDTKLEYTSEPDKGTTVRVFLKGENAE